ncbi:MAG: DEAD/DEAH box helicase family protein [Alphaproteobacteria bacterium]|nr:DEAD/DEAH box helicase family protein [Alphaproteobacteria bacterium]
MITAEEIKAKYWALEVLSSHNQEDINNISGSLGTSKIDLNPHQINAAMFALQSPISQGVILADEVGLGKTIEAGIVISEYYSRGKNSIIVVAPASLCQQWQTEMQEKFDLPTQILDSKIIRTALKEENTDILQFRGITICSYNCAVQFKKMMKNRNWDLVVIDEAHKLRNFYKGKTKIAEGINETFLGKKKLLLTATPIQNSLMDIFSLVSIIDPSILGNEYAFMENYLYSERHHEELKRRLQCVLHRTLRRDVLEYIKYTNREAMTVAFNPTKAEEELYTAVSAYIQDISQIAITTRFRTLIVLMIRKLMSSSTAAVKGTLEGLMNRLDAIEKTSGNLDELSGFMFDDDLFNEYEDDIEDFELQRSLDKPDFKKEDIKAEKAFLQGLIDKAAKIKVDGKTEKLIGALEQGFEKIQAKGGLRKAIIFTESNRTLNYLYDYLSSHGFKDKIVTFNGQNNSPLCNQIYSDYIENHSSDLTGSRTNDMKKALVTKFKEDAEIMIATEAAAEGLNLQFCSLLVNYDLPWNPQRVEQRIGRVHRYGQKCDVVIINFINKKNIADVRLYEILQQKFKLFDGVFGASDEILGTLSDGVDFERAVAAIFDLCRTTEEINRAFDELQESLGVQREEKLEEAKQLVLENLSPTTQEKLHIMKQRVEDYLERRKQIFWDLTVIMLKKNHPEMFINEHTKVFGQFKEQVFNLPSEINFAKSFNYCLNFNKREINYDLLLPSERKALNRAATTYNPDSNFGKRILGEAFALSAEPLHLHLKATDKLKSGQKGRLMLSLFKMTQPENVNYLITTIMSDGGSLLNLRAEDIFDNAVATDEPILMGYQDLLRQIHEQNVAKYEKSEKKRIDNILRAEVDKLNRWLIDEKQAIHLKGDKLKNKITSLKRQFKLEKNFNTKLAIDAEIKKLQAEMNNNEFNTFDIERELEKKCNRLVGGKKRSLKMDYSIEPVFNITWEVE